MTANLTTASAQLLISTLPVSFEAYRKKRQLWYGYDYDGFYGYGYTWSRIIISIMIVLALILCCLVPCICALGIWFAGWFGLRQRGSSKTSRSSPISNNSYAQQQQQPIVPQQPQQSTMVPQNSTPSGSASPRERVDTYVYEEKRSDHYYHRPPSPRPYDEYRRYYTSSRL